MNHRIVKHESVSSTNDLVKIAIAAGEFEGFAVQAYEQADGYGRQGRTWVSPLGGLYLSVLLRPQAAGVHPTKLPTLSLVVALAVRRALEALGVEGVYVKWPNDVVTSMGKMAGISMENHKRAICVGIGVNVFPQGRDMQVGGKYVPVYAVEHGLRAKESMLDTIDMVGEEILRQLDMLYPLWLEEDITPFLEEYAECSWLTGKTVQILDMSGYMTAQGKVVGVDEYGRLLLEKPDGSTRAVISGEAHIQY